MFDFLHLPPNSQADVKVYDAGTSFNNASYNYITWMKPRGITMAYMLCIGGAGGGGNGAVGAASTAAGGGGGGSGAQSSLLIPAAFLPDILYVSVGMGGQPNGGGACDSQISIAPNTTLNNRLLLGARGGAGGAASGATAGAAGTAGAATGLTQCPLAGMGVALFLAGQAGIIGGTNVGGSALTIPSTGLYVTGGTGGGGLPALNTAGTMGGAIAGGGIFPNTPATSGGAASDVSGNAGWPGASGIRPVQGSLFAYGGNGGGSGGLGAAGAATAVGGRGGNGANGCGGGGGGGGFTGAAVAPGGKGGDGLVIIVAW